MARETLILFMMGSLFLTLLFGAVIPLSVIVSSPSEFVTETMYKNPLQYVAGALLISSRFFLVWFPVFYYLASFKAKKGVCTFIWALCGVALTDYLVFGKVDVYISPDLQYDTDIIVPTGRMVLNLAALLIVITGMIVIMK